MITCPDCGKFVKVKNIWVNGLDKIIRVEAICACCGEVAALWTDYEELISEGAPPPQPGSGIPSDGGDRMSNLLVDFQLVRDGDRELAWRFRFGQCEDFGGALTLVKTIPFAERKYQPDYEHLWTVTPGQRNGEILTCAFENFASCLEAARCQIPLF